MRGGAFACAGLLALACSVVAEENAKRDAPPFEAPTVLEVNAAIDRGLAWLKSAQRKDGSWGPCVGGPRYDGGPGGVCYLAGPTAFSVFTLATCEVPRRDPAIKRGLAYLQKKFGLNSNHQFSTYESAAIVLMLTAVNADRKKRMARPSKSHLRPPRGSRFKKQEWKWMDHHLQKILIRHTSPNRLWRYWEQPRDEDLSATQFVLLALREARRAGYPVSGSIRGRWEDIAKAVTRFQMPNGAFRYQSSYQATLGMTAAGVASLLVCKEQIVLDGRGVPNSLDAALEKGLRYLGANWGTENRHDERRDGQQHALYNYYYLYTLERVGSMRDKKTLGGLLWYPRGAAFLLEQMRRRKTHWSDPTCMDPEDVLGTCFALLFLKRGTLPAITSTRR
ncbi:MAG: hypothetical protein AAGD14_01300 [Planctomycetota bacterium]